MLSKYLDNHDKVDVVDLHEYETLFVGSHMSKKNKELPVFLSFKKIRKTPGAPKLPESQVKIILSLVLHQIANKYFVFFS